MTTVPMHDRRYSPLDLERNWGQISQRLRAEVSELKTRGKGICYADPSFGGRIVREYPDGHKVFLVEDDRGELREVAIDAAAKAA